MAQGPGSRGRSSTQRNSGKSIQKMVVGSTGGEKQSDRFAIFAWQGKVEWGLGLALAAGTLLGGQLGVRLTVLKGHRWVRAVVTVTVVIFAIRLWFG